MKSKKAEDYINAHVVNFYDYKPKSRTAAYVVRLTSAIHAVELAELEAELRLRQKAYKIIKEMMSGIFHGDMPQKIATEFIQRMRAERKMRQTKNEEWIIEYLKGKDYVSPTIIGLEHAKAFGVCGLHHNSCWASPICLRMVKKGLLLRNRKGHYKLKEHEND